MLRPFAAEDIQRIVPQASQALDAAGRARILGESVPRGPCWTYVAADGRICAIGGFIHLHAGWSTAWTILAADIGASMVGLTRAVQDRLQQNDARRMDMHVDPASVASVRWAMMLGFRQEAWLERALPDGRPMTIWLYERNTHG